MKQALLPLAILLPLFLSLVATQAQAQVLGAGTTFTSGLYTWAAAATDAQGDPLAPSIIGTIPVGAAAGAAAGYDDSYDAATTPAAANNGGALGGGGGVATTPTSLQKIAGYTPPPSSVIPRPTVPAGTSYKASNIPGFTSMNATQYGSSGNGVSGAASGNGAWTARDHTAASFVAVVLALGAGAALL